MDDSELNTLTEEKEYWEELSYALNWELKAWSYKHTANFINSGGDYIEINGTTRDDILSNTGCEWPASGCRS